MEQKTIKTKCPKCGEKFTIRVNSEDAASLLLLLDENKEFIKRALSKSDKEWSNEEKEGLTKILDLMQRIENLYK